jgi:hypothetical protein
MVTASASPTHVARAVGACIQIDEGTLLQLRATTSQHTSRYFPKKHSIFPSFGYFRMANEEATVEHVSKDIFPKRKENPQLADEFVELGTFNKHSTQARTDGNLRHSRVHTEIRNS